MATLLCLDDEPAVCAVVEHALVDMGHTVMLATNPDDALRAVARQPVDLILSDYRMPEATGHDLLERLRERGDETPVIIMTAYSSIEHAVQSIRYGAIDYLAKPLRPEALRLSVRSALEMIRLRRENGEIRRELLTLTGSRAIVGRSKALQEVLETVASVAPTRAAVLVEGESGTGKELIARAVHERSPRKDEPFIAVNCAALPEGLVESTLFGHERGAFTGASARMQGAFERAHRGTLLLDEISEMRLDLQAKLLRAVQEQEFERVGGTQPIRVDVRIIATTNRNLAAEVDAGRFRRDLFYRLSVVPVRMPPLSARLDDIEPLVKHFVAVTAAQLGRKPVRVASDAIDYLRQRPWPGNIRELANVIERALILARGEVLTRDAFATDQENAGGGSPDPGARSEVFQLDDVERRTIARALAATGGHRGRAARLLGISERTLRNKLNAPGARPDQDSAPPPAPA